LFLLLFNICNGEEVLVLGAMKIINEVTLVSLRVGTKEQFEFFHPNAVILFVFDIFICNQKYQDYSRALSEVCVI
jgi:hypothetical protein